MKLVGSRGKARIIRQVEQALVQSHSHGILNRDTDPKTERLQVQLWRRMSPGDKAQLVSGLSIATQELALAGIRQRHPGASERECFIRLAELRLGPDLVRKVYPDAAAILDARK